MNVDQLRQETCRALKGPEHRLQGDALKELLDAVPSWSLREQDSRIGRDFRFDGFLPALAFANALGWLAERENHHPDLELGWGYVRVRLATHDVGGLSRNDLICAAKIDALLGGS